MLLLGEAPERLDQHVRFHPDKQYAGAIVVSSHLSGLAITLALQWTPAVDTSGYRSCAGRVERRSAELTWAQVAERLVRSLGPLGELRSDLTVLALHGLPVARVGTPSCSSLTPWLCRNRKT